MNSPDGFTEEVKERAGDDMTLNYLDRANMVAS